MSRFLPVILVGALVFCTGCPMGTTGNENMNDGDNENMNAGGEAVTFSASLNGANQLPDAVATDATGVAEFSLNDDGTALDFAVGGADGKGITQAHSHLGGPAEPNGGIVAFLFGLEDPGVALDGELARDMITADDLVGSLAGMPLSALLDEMRAGNTYVNIHSEENPRGEIRGQIAAVTGDDFVCFTDCGNVDVFKAIPGNGQRK